jgi:type III pantothenate kinase
LPAARALQEICGLWPAAIEFVEARVFQCGVSNRYETAAQLGSDRWAALIAAWHEVHGACLVVSCGTATTVDALSATGEFMGGLILPGLDMMRHSLKMGTAQLAETEGSFQPMPRNTADAIYSGAIQATLGAIWQQHVLLGVAAAPCLLCGGAAQRIASRLNFPRLQIDDLVLRGLRLIAQDVRAC